MTSIKNTPLCVRMDNYRDIINNPNCTLALETQEELVAILEGFEKELHEIARENQKTTRSQLTPDELEAGYNVIIGAGAPEVTAILNSLHGSF